MSWTRSLGVVWLAGSLVAACGGPPVAEDAGAADANVDAAPACRVDADCNDGLFCDGVERCVGAVCVSGTRVRCDDGVACTIDACIESLSRCVFSVPDLDGDGSGDAMCLDAMGVALGTDCDDHDPARFTGNMEQCDAAHVDEDCNPLTLGGRDDDGDGFVSAICCDGTTCGDDCDDTRLAVHIGATEVCNGIDDDCDGMMDEGVSVAGFVDADRDGYGDATRPRTACGTAVGFSPYGTDCDDTRASVHPGQPELCDGIDNDCDPATPLDTNITSVTWYRDADGDGFGTSSTTMQSCSPPAGYSLLGGDCDDASAGRSPGVAELCNGIDDDCNGVADYVIAPGDLEDDDRDGIPDSQCHDPRASDCDDRDPTSGPGSIEACDGRDNDCDGVIDENATQIVFYRDADGDGFGNSASVHPACIAPTGYSRRGGDCDDASSARFPGALESCNAIDDDCDTAVDEGSYASSSCHLAHASSVCIVGECRVATCDQGFADCSPSAPGCESDTLADTAHCGSCAPCTSGSCVAGTCTALCTPGNLCASTNPCAWSTCGVSGTCDGGTVVDCGPIRVDPTTSATTAFVGQARGSAFSAPCPVGEMAIGVQGKIDSSGFLCALSIVCSAAPVAAGVVTMPGTDVVPVAGVGISPSSVPLQQSICPLGSVLSGVDVSVVAGEDARGIRARCATLGVTGTAAAGNFAAAIGASTTAASIGSTASTSSSSCAAGSIATGMTGTAASYVAGVALTCGAPSLAIQTTTPMVGAGPNALYDCPAGQLPIALSGDSTISTYYDDTLMEMRFTCGTLHVTSDTHGGWTTTIDPVGGALLPIAGAIGNYYSHAASTTSTCPSNQVVVGLAGVSGAYGPSQATLYCAPILVTGDASSGFTIRYGTVSPLPPIGTGNAGPPTYHAPALCPQGTVGIGYRTESGEVMAGLGLRCAPPPIAASL